MSETKFYGSLLLYPVLLTVFQVVLVGRGFASSFGQALGSMPVALLLAYLIIWCPYRLFFADTEEARSPSERRSFLCYRTGVILAMSFWGLWLGGNL